MKHLLIILPVALLAACQSPSASKQPEQEKTADTCGYSTRVTLVGIPAAEINQSSLPPGTRILYPDSVMTRDFRADRLNIHVDADGKVEKVVCG